jgi:hypothetical protein
MERKSELELQRNYRWLRSAAKSIVEIPEIDKLPVPRIGPAVLASTLCLRRGKVRRNVLFPELLRPRSRVSGRKLTVPVSTRLRRFLIRMASTLHTFHEDLEVRYVGVY